MPNYKCEYIWLDGNQPEANLRSKTRIIRMNAEPSLLNLPVWSHDGSSTQQASGDFSDCTLNPIRVLPDGGRKNGYLVMCEVLNPDGTPHKTNQRAKYRDVEDFWFDFGQQYMIMHNGLPIGSTGEDSAASNGMHYCGVGTNNVAHRDFVEEHLEICLATGLNITGINAEGMLGQWEFQLLGKGAKTAADDLWIARFLLMRTAEKYGYTIELHPKPVKGEWSGSALYTNFSNAIMREEGGESYFKAILENLKDNHEEHMEHYGSMNHERLTGQHKTQSFDTFSYGVGDREASIRIPIATLDSHWKGVLQDRRPASNACPYRITARIIQTVTTEAALA